MSLNICQISKLNQFTMDFIKKKVSTQLEQLKSQIESSIVFFNSSYIIIDIDSNELLEEKFTNGYEHMITNGYANIGKINLMLEILITSDNSQTNKYKYDESLKIIFNPGSFLNVFNELRVFTMTKNIEKCLNKGKIYKNWSDNAMVQEIDNLHKEKDAHTLNEKINIFNHYVNTIILQLCKMKLELQNTQIYSD